MTFKGIKHWHIVTAGLIIYDILAVNIAYFLALWFRFDCKFSMIEPQYWETFTKFAPFYTVVCIAVLAMAKLYRSIWRFASFTELLRVGTATVATFVVQVLGTTLFFERMPISYYMSGVVLQFFAILAVRFSYRFVLLMRNTRSSKSEKPRDRVMIIGAGIAGQMILRDISKAKECNDKAWCVIDDNPNKWGRYIDGVPVVGGRQDIVKSAIKYEIAKIYIAIPSASAEDKRAIYEICRETGCEIKNLPGIYQLVNGEVTVSQMKEVAIEDLLGRDTIQLTKEGVFDYIKDKTILVTGGGGSIGSELCRQIAARDPKQLIIFDIYENNVYEIQQELIKMYPELDIKALIGSVRETARINEVFKTYKPDIVYHAAAHKHVPLMEDSPKEAIKNNVMGTYKTAQAAASNGCSKFVLISTDKAVNPTNIMGASKRLCEMIVQLMNETSKTDFVAVRFGNVLGSNGSVIPLFKKQIAEGGPVTVTHPEIIRYFMTIPEAVNLVLQAGGYAKGGEIFVLDMGSPVKIDTLARNLIRLSGLKPDIDIKIKYTGLRPGEKLFEEKLMDEEGLERTENDLIHIGKPIPMDRDVFFKQLEAMKDACQDEEADIVKLVAEIVTTYQPAENK